MTMIMHMSKKASLRHDPMALHRRHGSSLKPDQEVENKVFFSF